MIDALWSVRGGDGGNWSGGAGADFFTLAAGDHHTAALNLLESWLAVMETVRWGTGAWHWTRV